MSDKKPVYSFQYQTDRQTTVEFSVWANEIENDGENHIVYNATVKRSYRTDDGWKNNQNFRPHDLPFVALGFQRAFHYITTQK